MIDQILDNLDYVFLIIVVLIIYRWAGRPLQDMLKSRS